MNTWDVHALTRQIQEATRAMEIATAEITDLRRRLYVLEEENERLRIRLARNADLLRRMEEGDL